MNFFKKYFNPDSGELFGNLGVLDGTYIPNIFNYREKEMTQIAGHLSPLLENKKPNNVIIWGSNGIGKTTAMRKLTEDLCELDNQPVIPIWIDGKKDASEYDIYNKIYNEVVGKSVKKGCNNTLFIKDIAEKIEEKKSLLLIIDDVHYILRDDKKREVLNNVLKKFGRSEETYNFYCGIVLISNKPVTIKLDKEGHSVFKAKEVYFDKYTRLQLRNIIKERCNYAFYEKGIITDEMIERIIDEVEKDNYDIRTAWDILRSLASKMKLDEKMPDIEMLEFVINQSYLIGELVYDS